MSPHQDVMDLLADARPARLDPDRDTRRADPASFTAHSRPAIRSRRPRRLVLAGLVPPAAVAATVAVILAVGAPGAGPGATGTRPPTAETSVDSAPQTARDLLLVAAQHTAGNSAARGRYWVVDAWNGEVTEVGPAGHTYHVCRTLNIQRWEAVAAGAHSALVDRYLGARPASNADEAAWKADGAPTQWTQGRGAESVVIKASADTRSQVRAAPTRREAIIAGTAVSYAELAGLPATPDGLRAWLLGLMAKKADTESPEWGLFWAGAALVLDLPVSPQVRAAAYRMLAGVKGVTSLGTVTDARGRTGVAVGFARKGDGGHWAQTRLIVDPRTGQALGEQTWVLGSGARPAATGTLTGYTLVASARFTDENPPA